MTYPRTQSPILTTAVVTATAAAAAAAGKGYIQASTKRSLYQRAGIIEVLGPCNNNQKAHALFSLL
jgi:polyphosphate kinase 2 (PPK2 family)